ncbi:zf-HC2 domain-containing protein, partial [Streptomyces sp. T-3]|nr:zf-HC2 domain-containing protein [Streptomyces sp. T-3]
MRTLEPHRDAAAYALGVLDRADSFRFEDHLLGCPACVLSVSEFTDTTRVLARYELSTPHRFEPPVTPSGALLDRLLREVAGPPRGIWGRRLGAA